jgi:preprotein translocase subunit SecE
LGVRIPPPLPYERPNNGNDERSENMKPIREWWPATRDFFRDVWVEMKKVSWPGKNEVIGTTVVVIVACFIFGFYLFVVDQGLSWLIDKLFISAGVSPA